MDSHFEWNGAGRRWLPLEGGREGTPAIRARKMAGRRKPASGREDSSTAVRINAGDSESMAPPGFEIRRTGLKAPQCRLRRSKPKPAASPSKREDDGSGMTVISKPLVTEKASELLVEVTFVKRTWTSAPVDTKSKLAS